jgi:hypothetical protein
LTLDTFGQSARILVNEGVNTISAPVVQNQNLVVTTAAASSVKFTGPWTLNNAASGLGLAGSGTVGLASQTFNESSLTINGGTLALSSATLNLTGTGTTSTSIVNLSAGGTFTVDTHSSLNIGSESMFIEYGSGTSPVGDLSFARTARNYPANSLQRYAQTGFAGFGWNGPGISSSYAANDPNGLTAVGIADENDLGNVYPGDNTVADGGTGTWQGVPVSDTNNVLVRMTYYGDGNDDGVVNRLDVSALSQGYNGIAGYVGWSDGDYVYGGDITKVDVSLLAQSYLFQGAPLGNAITAGQAQYLLALDPDMSAAAKADFQSIAGTPEPSSVAEVGAAVAGLLARRRRNHRGF